MSGTLDELKQENEFLRNIWIWSKEYFIKGDQSVLMKLQQAVAVFDAYNSKREGKRPPLSMEAPKKKSRNKEAQ